MKRKTHRAGAIASAFMLFAMLLAGDGSGAYAQSELANEAIPAFEPEVFASAEPEIRLDEQITG